MTISSFILTAKIKLHLKFSMTKKRKNLFVTASIGSQFGCSVSFCVELEIFPFIAVDVCFQTNNWNVCSSNLQHSKRSFEWLETQVECETTSNEVRAKKRECGVCLCLCGVFSVRFGMSVLNVVKNPKSDNTFAWKSGTEDWLILPYRRQTKRLQQKLHLKR